MTFNVKKYPNVGDIILITWKFLDPLNKVKMDKFDGIVIAKKKEEEFVTLTLIRQFKNCMVKHILPINSKNLIYLEITGKIKKKINKAKLFNLFK